jgi:hypothetical protein
MEDHKVTITLDPNGNLRVGPGVSKNGQDKVKWKNKTGLDGLIIEFADSPFEGPNRYGPINNGDSANSGKLRGDVQPGAYKYTVKLGSKVLDPNVIVDP